MSESWNNSPFAAVIHEADFCVVGGGMPGLAAALAAARRGARTVLMHDRPVLGGNASSECRVHISGADVHNHYTHMRETGILEELRQDNLRRNHHRSFSVWDGLLYEKARSEPNLTLLLNCSCLAAEMAGCRIESVAGWQLTTQTMRTVRAKIFADCTGDAILAPVTGAAFRVGREGRDEFGESIAPLAADNRTMGMTCLFQSRDCGQPMEFDPLPWARRFDRCEDLPYGPNKHDWFQMGYWWVELGGEADSIGDTERLRDELLAITLGVWDHIKNRCPRTRAAAANWAIDWIQFLPGKRESRRYVGAHVLTQNDIAAGGPFADRVAYGGWSMDDHHPAGFEAVRIGAAPTIFHDAPSPYGIPYRALYSRNVANLMFAGRDASCTHAAMSSTRVMGTGMSMGQAVGTAAAMACRLGVGPAGLIEHIDPLQQALLEDDAYLPGVPQRFSDLTMRAKLSASRGDPGPLRDGINRQVAQDAHCWPCSPGDWAAYEFTAPRPVRRVTLIVDGAMDRRIQMSYHQRDDQLTDTPDVMHRDFRIEGLIDGVWRTLRSVTNNHQRLVRVDLNATLAGVRYVLEHTWGSTRTRLYAFYVD